MVGDILQPTHLLFVLVVALLVLGPKRLPEVARTLGKGIRDFRGAITGEGDEHDQHSFLPSEDPPAPAPAPAPATAAHETPAPEARSDETPEPAAHEATAPPVTPATTAPEPVAPADPQPSVPTTEVHPIATPATTAPPDADADADVEADPEPAHGHTPAGQHAPGNGSDAPTGDPAGRGAEQHN